MWRLTDEQRELRERLREFVLTNVRPKMLEVAETCDYPFDVHEALAAEGLLGLAIPERYGGRGADSVSFGAYIEELAKVSATVSLMAAYVKLTALPIMLAGSEEQKRRFLPGLASGEQLGSYALTEPNVGSDPGALQTRAVRCGDRWVLSGEKRFIGNAGLSDLYAVFARTGDPGPKGISAFVVPGDSPGLSVKRLRTMGMPGWQLGAPRFDEVEVPTENLLRGRRLQDRHADLRSLPAPRRLAVRRRRPGGGRSRARLRAAALFVRGAAVQPPGHRVQARPTRGRGRRRSRASLSSRHICRRGQRAYDQDLRRCEAVRLRRGDACDHRGGAGAGRERLSEGLSGREDDARRQGAADLRRCQRDPGAGDRPPDAQRGRHPGADLARSDAGGRGNRRRPRRPSPQGADRIKSGASGGRGVTGAG